jgi:2-dehydro-3-deoxygluconokinase
VRAQETVERQTLAAFFADRTGTWTAGPLGLDGVVDRIGAGDAFAAGVVFGETAGWPKLRTLEFGLAAAALKHGVRGDFALIDEATVAAVAGGRGPGLSR